MQVNGVELHTKNYKAKKSDLQKLARILKSLKAFGSVRRSRAEISREKGLFQILLRFETASTPLKLIITNKSLPRALKEAHKELRREYKRYWQSSLYNLRSHEIYRSLVNSL